MEDVETFWDTEKKIIIPAFIFALIFMAGVIFGGIKFEEHQKKKDTFVSLGALVNVDLVATGFLDGNTTKVITDKGIYFVNGTVNAKFGSPVIFQNSYGWGRDDCIKIDTTCYNINGEIQFPKPGKGK